MHFFYSLSDVESELNIDVLKCFVYIAGYISTPTCSNEDTKFYHETYGSYFDTLNRGGLKIPSDKCCQFTVFCYIMFQAVKDKTCRKSQIRIFHLVSEKHDLQMTEVQCRKLANIFFKNYCLLCSPNTRKESSVKVLKLSNV